MAGVLIYTSAPDSEGTLGGLVCPWQAGQAGSASATRRSTRCACVPPTRSAPNIDPGNGDKLHGASCHACSFLPETSLRAGQQVSGSVRAGEDAGAGRLGLLRVIPWTPAHELIAEAATRLASRHAGRTTSRPWPWRIQAQSG